MLGVGETIRAVEAIEKVIDEAADGWANETALRAIDVQLFTLKTGRSDGYILEKVGIISEMSRVLYSPRKAARWGGSEQVKLTVLSACQSLKDRARNIEWQTSEARPD